MAYLQPLIFYILAALAIFSLISNSLVKVFRTDLHTITNLRLVPWGNAEIHCQKEHLEFIRCTEQQSLKGGPVEALWKNCSEKLRLNEEIINKCYTTGFGYKLLLQYANETAHLKPPQEDVPWVVVNNQPLRQDFENFVKYVRQDYKGDHKPATRKAQSSNLSPIIHASFAVPQQPAIPHFYKLALQWPPSVCSSTSRCKTPIPTEFTIHGIWAQDANDKPVTQYGPSNLCNNPNPNLDKKKLESLLKSDPVLWVDLPRLWPNLILGKLDISFLHNEWTKHGTCSDFAPYPLAYFQSAIQLRTNLDPAMGLTPRSTYTVRQVADIVFRLIGASPQISCSKHRRTRVLLLGEMFICYGRPGPSHTFGTPQNCSNLFYGLCSNGSDTIKLP
ncbi:uncharacterized protein LOC105775761 isoform X3 [Gossypium raimondii]|uniref:uncharacterized protein LOC105775761 isoform X3 n=1 Tax=Gossypium raimondii TaxID=29730 RepID=UPI00063A8FA3|nr:uncharacterized protein LOC105775761 isoform X3 [Gossypium raimondii]XP_052478278.1 uncharacterized protein LOC105775761 isoform X3 [Gossypium raimondii]